MFITDPCKVLVVSDIQDVRSFVSDYGHAVLIIVVAVKALLFTLFRSPLREGRELGCALALTCVFGAWIAFSQSYPPKWATQLAAVCVQDGPAVASSGEKPEAGTATRQSKARRVQERSV
jgi:hypothetical protein